MKPENELVNKFRNELHELRVAAPAGHFTQTVITSQGMERDFLKYPVLHRALIELLSLGATVKMANTGTGTFEAKIGPFKFRFIFGSGNQIILVLFANDKQIAEYPAEAISFYNFDYSKGVLYYKNLHLATAKRNVTHINDNNLKNIGA